MHNDAAAAVFKDARKNSAPSVNKKPAQRIPPGGFEDGAKAGYFFDIPGHAFTQGRKDMRAKLFAYSNVLAAIGT